MPFLLRPSRRLLQLMFLMVLGNLGAVGLMLSSHGGVSVKLTSVAWGVLVLAAACRWAARRTVRMMRFTPEGAVLLGSIGQTLVPASLVGSRCIGRWLVMLTLRHRNGRTEILPVVADALSSDRHRALRVLAARHAQRRAEAFSDARTQGDPRPK
ncbi:MAG: hypothetical protein KGK15_05420 [Burkholderiales bacterium]|nr:hypothetical protein [Burkholderiales bacterium]MDE2287674.1 hypothetical protein [Burkholderiales bacterium]MDE2610455.1 hypothetical protein [Burkholderiales bacterium]